LAPNNQPTVAIKFAVTKIQIGLVVSRAVARLAAGDRLLGAVLFSKQA
jgi:hypothetical protein